MLHTIFTFVIVICIILNSEQLVYIAVIEKIFQSLGLQNVIGKKEKTCYCTSGENRNFRQVKRRSENIKFNQIIKLT